MKIIVCGGRSYIDKAKVDQVLSVLHEQSRITLVIEGGATGADYLGRLWAGANGVPIQTFRAQWQEYGRSAGMIRNRQMLEEGKPDLVVAFPGGAGTANMIRNAKKQNVRVLEVPNG